MKKILAMTLCVLLLVTALVGCGASRDAGGYKNDAEDYYLEAPEVFAPVDDYYYESGYAPATTTAPSAPVEAVSTNRKLIRTVSLSVETEEYDALLNDISARIAACGGYLESMNADTRYSSDSRYAYMTVRVPAERLDEFVTAVSGISNVVQRSENTEDVTLTYVDLESHTNALRTEQERLISLLEQAENLTEILEIEDRLTDVRYQLEYMESQIRTYDNLVDYATVSLSISEVKKLTPTVEKGFWENVGDGFMDSLGGVWEGLKSFFSGLVIHLPYLLAFAVFAGIVIAVVALCVKKSRKKAAKRQPAPMPQQPFAPYPPAAPQQTGNPAPEQNHEP